MVKAMTFANHLGSIKYLKILSQFPALLNSYEDCFDANDVTSGDANVKKVSRKILRIIKMATYGICGLKDLEYLAKMQVS